MKILFTFTLAALFSIVGSFSSKEKSNRLAQNFLILDSHIDVPYRLQNNWEDIGEATKNGQFDFFRAKKGGLNAAFMSIYVPSSYSGEDGYVLANKLIDQVEGICEKHPHKFKLATSTDEILQTFRDGKIALPLGMENGSPINRDLTNLAHFYQRGVRYITLCHSKSNDICDSSTDTKQLHGGLSPFGVAVVQKMNELGMMVDVSHVSDESMEDVLEVTKAPIIASHSNCKALTPDFSRNINNELLKRIGENGGVVMINFGTMFLNNDAGINSLKLNKALAVHNFDHGSMKRKAFITDFLLRHPIDGSIQQVADHIDHVVKLIGIDHVGLGSDFDGVGPFVPADLSDVSMYPNLIEELLRRGYSEDFIEKICGKNLLRVWKQVEEIADH